MIKLLQLRKAVEDLIASLRPRSGAGGPSNSVTIEGPRSLKQGIDYQWWISNFDSFSTYDISVNSGNVSRNVDYINYKLPIGYPTPRPLELDLVRNGVKRTVKFPIEMVGILPPDILSVVEDQRIEGLVLSIQLGTFATLPANGDTHKSTSVEIATDSGFTNVIWSSLNNTTNKYTFTTPALPGDSKLYLRARYNGNTYPYSAWSNVMFRTDKKWVTSFSSSWMTSWGNAPLRTTSQVTQWITETYSVLENENRTTSHKSLTSRTTSWDTAMGYVRSTSRTTEYFSKVDSITSKNTQWLTNGMKSTSVQTGISDYDEKTTSWDTQSVWMTEIMTDKTTSVIDTLSRTTTYDTVERKNTNWTTTWSTQNGTSAYTSWTTSNGTIHVTAWNSVQSWQTQVPYTANPSVSSPKFGTNINMGYSFYLGGWTWSIGYGSELDNAYGNMRLEYHDGTRITILPSEGAVPNPHNAAAVWHYNQKIYIFGGALPNGVVSGNLHMYSLSSNSWVLMSSTPGKRSSLLFSKVGNVFFIFGGVGEGEQYMWRYHTTSDTWVKMDPIPSWGSSTLSNGSGYECAEYGNGFYYYRHHDNTLWYFSYSANSGSWSKIMDLPSPQENLMTRNSAIGIVNGRLYLLYTHLDVFKSTASFLIYRLDTGTRTYTKVADIKAADTTGGARTERVMFDGSSFHVIYPGAETSYMTDVKYVISGFDAPSGTQNVYTSVSTPMSRTTSYNTVYSTGQDTSWTTTYDTSMTTGVITSIEDLSRLTSIATSKHTAV